MAISIKNEETYTLAKELSRLTGKSITFSITEALREKLSRLSESKKSKLLPIKIQELALHCSNLPRLDSRSDSEIMGYDEDGLAS